MLRLYFYIVSLCWKVFYIHWIYFKLIQMLSWFYFILNCINTRHILNINLIYEICKQIYIVPKGGIYDFVITNFNHICLNLHDYLINSNSSLMLSHHNHDHSHLCHDDNYLCHHSSHLCYAMDDHDLERSCDHGCWFFIILNQIIIMENASND